MLATGYDEGPASRTGATGAPFGASAIQAKTYVRNASAGHYRTVFTVAANRRPNLTVKSAHVID